MKPEEWWKNFVLGVEVDISGTFIYNGIKRLDELDGLSNPADIFEILYSLSVGIERLLKVAIVLIEHDNQLDMEKFEKSLISHDVMGLAHRVTEFHNLGLSNVHNEFLSLLSKFYKTHRYGRFSLGSIPNIKSERDAFLQYLEKHLKIEVPHSDSFIPVYNSDKIRKFIGKVVCKIAKNVFNVISKQARTLNIYTNELRGDSKAIQVFYAERLDFIDERIKKKELLLFLMHPKSSGGHIDLVRSFEPLDLEPDMTSSYMKALINDSHLHDIEGEIDELYFEIKDVGKRIELIEIIDSEYLSYGENEEP